MTTYKSIAVTLVAALIVICCTTKNESLSKTDSLSVPEPINENNVTTISTEEDEAPTEFEANNFNALIERESYLALQKFQGKIFEGYSVDVDLLRLGSDTSSTLVAFVTSSDSTNEYENWSYNSYLVIFETVGDSLHLIDQIELPASSQYRLMSAGIDVSTYDIHKAGAAIAVTSSSKEEGAGDSGYNKEHLDLYILIGNKLTNIFSYDTRDDSFASCECDDEDGYYQADRSATVTIETSATEDFFDLQVQETWSNTKEAGETTWTTFRWNGDAYAAVEEEVGD